MARIDYIKYRLNNWALWKVRESSGGLGYASVSVLLSEPVDGHKSLMGTIEDTDAELTNAAVESLRPTRPKLYETLQLVYIANLGNRETARRLGCAESTLSARLDEADRALMAWFDADMDAKRSKKVVLQHRGN